MLLQANQENSIFLEIGDYFYYKNNYAKAKKYYSYLLRLEFNEEVAYKLEKIDFFQGYFSTPEQYLLSYVKKYPYSSLNISIKKDLARYYLLQDKHNEVIDLLKYDSDINLLFLRAKAYWNKKQLNFAMNDIERILNIKSEDYNVELVQKNTLNLYWEILLNFSNLENAVNNINNLLNKINNEEKHKDLLLILAELYQKESFYDEANQIYKIIAEKSDTPYDYYLKIVENNLKEKKYYKAANEMGNLLLLDTTYTEEVYLSISNVYSEYLKNYKIAEYYLFYLYNHYEKSRKNQELLSKLFDIYSGSDNHSVIYFLSKELNKKIDYKQIEKNISNSMLKNHDKLKNYVLTIFLEKEKELFPLLKKIKEEETLLIKDIENKKDSIVNCEVEDIIEGNFDNNLIIMDDI